MTNRSVTYIDSYGFVAGILAHECVCEYNIASCVFVQVPEQVLDIWNGWCWSGTEWVATPDNRGRVWYNPAATAELYRAVEPSDTPPEGYLEWVPGEDRVTTATELLQRSQNLAWASVKLKRSAAEYAGFTWDGSVFDSDAASQSKIQGSVQLAALIPNLTLGWTLADNTTRVLSSADMLQVGVALGTHVMTQFAISQQLRELIFNATTVEEVEAIAWPSM